MTRYKSHVSYMTDKFYNKNTGRAGEKLAEEYLQKKGYKMLQRNFRTKFGEIDLVCQDNDTLVFVEVKTKVGEEWGSPEEMVNRRKLDKIKRMAMVYAPKDNILKRIDVVAVVLNYDNTLKRINHYEGVY